MVLAVSVRYRPGGAVASKMSFVPCPKAYEDGTWTGVAGRLKRISRRRSSRHRHPAHLGQPRLLQPPTARARRGSHCTRNCLPSSRRHDPRHGRDRGEQATPAILTEMVRDELFIANKADEAARVSSATHIDEPETNKFDPSEGCHNTERRSRSLEISEAEAQANCGINVIDLKVAVGQSRCSLV